MVIGTELKLERIRQNLKQEWVSEEIGIHKSFLSRIENNKEQPSLGTLVRLLDLYGLELKFNKKIVR